MNNRGYVTTTVAVSIMITTLAFLAVFYATIRMRNVQIALHEPAIEHTIAEHTAQERLYGVFRSDYYRTADIVYEDLGVTYTIEGVEQDEDSRLLRLHGSRENLEETQFMHTLDVVLEDAHTNHPSQPPFSMRISAINRYKEDE